MRAAFPEAQSLLPILSYQSNERKEALVEEKNDREAQCTVSREPFGTLPDGDQVEAITVSNRSGMSARIITYGASIHAVQVRDREGRLADVALGNAMLQEYIDQPQFIGSTVGRVANRIAGGRFVLDGVEYRVPLNNGPNSLHGGTVGFDKVNWTVAGTQEGERAAVTLRHVSPDGDQGYPGTLTVTATYSLGEDDALQVEYCATTDRPTLVNLSNHAYWNLAGEGAPEGAMGHVLAIPADHYLPTDATAIPTGEVRPVAGTPFDFRDPCQVGERVRDASDQQIRFGRGYDHNWAIGREVSAEPRLLARVEEPGSGRVMEILSNQPGVQFYSGNFLDGTSMGKSGRLYRMGDAVVLEPQMYPDTPNRPEFGSVRLEPGETYCNIIIWRFSARARP
jgi:aldose 1-epimerase